MALRNIPAAVLALSALHLLSSAHPVSEEGAPLTLSRAEILRWMTIGTKVVRGADWSWGTQDGTPPGEGRIITELSDLGWIEVEWEGGTTNTYRMGKDGKYDLKLVEDGQIRLADGEGDGLSGRVEIIHDGTLGTVCDVNWDMQDAAVACRQLDSSLEPVEVKTGSFYGGSRAPIVMSRVACAGTESRLADCPFVCTSSRPCDTSQVAGVVCGQKRNTVRLVGEGSNPASGRVEIYHNGTWGTICDNDWDLDDARVVCLQLGFPGATEAKSAAHFGQGVGPIHMEGVACDGSESQLADCPSHCWKQRPCSHAQDAGAICRQDKEP